MIKVNDFPDMDEVHLDALDVIFISYPEIQHGIRDMWLSGTYPIFHAKSLDD